MHLARIGHETTLWARDAAFAADIEQRRFNPVYLPEIRFPANVRVTADVGDALGGSDLVIAAVPSHGTREVLRKAAPHLRAGATVVSATKGLEGHTLYRMSEIVEQECPPATRVAVLSGPSFAIELARELPTAVSIASQDPTVVERVQAEFRAPYFRLYGTDDVVGVEVGGALKNVIAIAAGVVEGLGLGHNALAALLTRGLAEMSRLACAAGAKRETLAGLTGLGDLVLTCTGHLSRNRHVGVELGRVKGSGAKGRVTADDVKAFVKEVMQGGGAVASALPAVPAVDFAKYGRVESEPLSRIQKISGPRLHASWVNVPHVTQHDEADITELEEKRAALKEQAQARGIKLTPLAFIVRACALALAEMPLFKSSLSPDGARLYTSNRTANSVSVIDTGSRRVLAEIPVGAGPAGIAVGTDGQRVFVANRLADTLSVIDVDDAELAQLRPQLLRAQAYAFAHTDDLKSARRVLRKLSGHDARLLGGFMGKKTHPLLQREARKLLEQSGAVPRKVQFQRRP